jgi:hypothetical protein
MRIIYKLISFLFLFGFVFTTFGQTASISVGTQIPLQYQAIVNVRPIKNFSASFGYGILTKPYDGAILDILRLFDTDEQLLNIIDCAFDKGIILETNLNYHFKRNYFKVLGQKINLQAGTTTTELLEEKSQLDFSIFGAFQFLNPLKIDIESKLFNLGIGYGRTFPIKNIEGLSVNLEFNISKTFGSKNTMSSNYTNLDKTNKIQDLYIEIDKYLNDEIYVKYVYVPTFNVYLTYTFRGKNRFD